MLNNSKRKLYKNNRPIWLNEEEFKTQYQEFIKVLENKIENNSSGKEKYLLLKDINTLHSLEEGIDFSER